MVTLKLLNDMYVTYYNTLFRSYQILTNQDFNIRLVDVNKEKNNGFLAGVSLPPSWRAPRFSLAPKTPFPKTPFPFPFKRQPRRLAIFLSLSYKALL